jgi:hypothetical protein
MSDDDNVIRFTAQVSQIRTLADGGIRIILDLPEDAIKQAGQMMEVKLQGYVLEVAAIAVNTNG